jgi:microcystin degradation protein MlrC
VVVTARHDRQAAEDLAQEIAHRAWSMRHGFVRTLTTVDEAVGLALDVARPPVIFSDAGDNPGGGGSGRTTELLDALHRVGAQSVFYGSFYDPELAAEAHERGEGAVFTARFNRSAGDATWESWDRPFAAEAKVARLHDGEVVGRLGMTAGRRMHLGPSVRLRIGGIEVIVISDRTQTADPIFFEMMGLDVADARTVVVKSRGHFRAGFLPWFPPERVYEVDTAGLTSPVLERWPFEHLRRPSFPLDPDTVWDG